MKKIPAVFVTGIAILTSIFTTVIFAENIYLTQTSQGSNDGTSPATAHAYTFFNNSANWGSGADKIGPGDTVHLCGTFNGAAGQQWLVAQGSGTSGNPITIKFETNAIMKAPYHISTGAIEINNRSWIVIDGGTNGTIQNTLNGSPNGSTCPGGPCSQNQNAAEISATNVTNVEVKNMRLLDAFVVSTGGNSSQNLQNNLVISGSHINVHDNVMTNAGINIRWEYNQNNDDVNFYNNDISLGGWSMECAGSNYTATNIRVYNNHFHDNGIWGTTGAHVNGLHCYNGSGGGIQDLYLYNNLFDGYMSNCCWTSWVYLEGDGAEWAKPTGSLHAWNNVFIAELALGNGLLAPNGGGTHEVYNNTFLGPANSPNGSCLNNRGGTSASTMIFKNNAFSGCGQAFSFDGNVGNVIADNNAYANLASGNSIFNWSGHAGDGGSLANWQAGTGQDAASQANLTGALGMNGSGVPQAGSMVIGRGANLTSLGVPTLLNDKAGNPRPATGAWDVGAYNYGSVIGVLEKPRARNRNAQPLFMWPNPIKAALLYQYLHTQPNVSMYDVTGKVFTIGSITHNGIYVVKNGKNMVRQKLMVIK